MRANKGSPGVDSESVEMFEDKLKDNLYKLWNRMSSGSYFPPPVKLVEIPKSNGGRRTLGIPTISDRISQTVVKKSLESLLEPLFHTDSYGYRPEKSALKAIGAARQRCWKSSWVIDLDIKGFFDNIDHDLMMQLVQKHTQEKWVLLYIDRWLKAPGVNAGGEEVRRDKGTPQGGVISPLLANLFLHHAFDDWMRTEFSTVNFERYADDIIVHCITEKQAKYVLQKIKERMVKWKLDLHPEKTRIIYCKDDNRKGGDGKTTKFDFLGYTFRMRTAKNSKGQIFNSFTPAMSDKAQKKIRQTIRDWRFNKMTAISIKEIADKINPVIHGWINYYGVYCKWELKTVFRQLNFALAKWAARKFKKLHRKWGQATRWLTAMYQREPTMFAHWAWK